MEVVRNKWNTGNLVAGLVICAELLCGYSKTDSEIYQKLVEVVLSDHDIAKITGCDEVYFYAQRYSYLLMILFNTSISFTEEQKAFILEEVKDNNPYHGRGYFDYRYYILRNASWSLEEKKTLLKEFYSEEEFLETLDGWKWDIINNDANFKKAKISPMQYDDLYRYKYEQLFNFYLDKETTDQIWSDIEFCKQMENMYEKDTSLCKNIRVEE